MGADEPANGEGVIEGTPQYAQDQPYGAAIDAGRAAPTARPASAASLERHARLLPDAKYKIATSTRARPGARARRSPAAPRVPAGQTFTRRAGDRPVLATIAAVGASP